MRFVVGIDEAGYGPNLGPLIQAAVGLELPAEDCHGWDHLRLAVRRCEHEADDRLLVDDSKKVYTRSGLAGLERAVLAFTGSAWGTVRECLHDLAAPDALELLSGEPWFCADETLPVAAELTTVEAYRTHLNNTLPSVVSAWLSIVPPGRFNSLCDEYGTKGAILGCGLVELLRRVTARHQPDGHPLVILADKQGGRNYYASLVQQAFPGGWVVAECESPVQSSYRVEGLDWAVTVTFRPRADAGSLAVALASMVCKYVREVLMRQFNRFWGLHVPGIAATAGYPLDARRFYAEIGPAMVRLNLTPDQVWRKR